MITLEYDDHNVAAYVGSLDKRAHTALFEAMDESKNELQALIQSKLSGPVLQYQSGTLFGSIQSDITDDGEKIEASVWTEGVVYAKIHEYGGDIFPVNAPALHFYIDGREIFSQHVVMPERSYMRSSLADMKSEIIARMEAAVTVKATAA